MARPIKEGLDYFPFDVDFFFDRKIKRLRVSYGSDGICVYLYILCQIYGDKGYYVQFDDDLILDISDTLSISENSTRQIVGYLLSRSLLDSTLAQSVKVLSAKSVQRRFQEAKKKSKRNVFVKAKMWLLKKAETLSFIKVCPDERFSKNNSDFSEKNADKSEKNYTKESKGDKSKVNNESDKAKNRFTPPSLDEVKAYCEDRKNNIDPQHFVDYYQANGWKVGRNNMKDWKAAVRRWETNGYNSKRPDKPHSSYDLDEFEEFAKDFDLSKAGGSHD